jgi:hypothetical protein
MKPEKYNINAWRAMCGDRAKGRKRDALQRKRASYQLACNTGSLI